MSKTTIKIAAQKLRRPATLFSALGDETRLTLLNRLSECSILSITQLSESSPLTRQAITKHLRILESVGLVQAHRRGREALFQLDPAPLGAARQSLEAISQHWGEALARLKNFVER